MPRIKKNKAKSRSIKPKKAADISYIGRELQTKVYNLVKE